MIQVLKERCGTQKQHISGSALIQIGTRERPYMNQESGVLKERCGTKMEEI